MKVLTPRGVNTTIIEIVRYGAENIMEELMVKNINEPVFDEKLSIF